MSLRLTITKSPDSVNIEKTSVIFDASGGSIGRGGNNTWVVSDPDRFLSSKHCEFISMGGQYYIIDLSTNGTYLNNADEPIGKGGQAAITTGDSFEMGDYVFSVEIEGVDAGASKKDSFNTNSPHLDALTAPMQQANPFDNLVTDSFAPGTSANVDSKLADNVNSRNKVKDLQTSTEDVLAQPLTPADPFTTNNLNVNTFGSRTTDSSSMDSRVAEGGHQGFDDVNLNADTQNVDPLAAFDMMNEQESSYSSAPIDASLNQKPNVNSLDGRLGENLGESLNESSIGSIIDLKTQPTTEMPQENESDLIGILEGDATNHLPNANSPVVNSTETLGGTVDEFKSHSDGAHSLNQAIEWPQANTQSLIPDNWDNDDALLDKKDGPTLTDLAHVVSKHTLNASEYSHKNTAHPPSQPQAFPAEPSRQNSLVGKEPSEHEEPSAYEKPLVHEKPSAREEPSAHQEPSVHREPSVQNSPPVQEPTQQQTPDGLSDILIKALGFDYRHLSVEQKTRIHELVAELLPEITEGMMQVLRSRASIKNEFRMNVTTIQPVENNPLKFSANVQEAFDNMFLRESNAYKKPVEAYQEGFESVAHHQVAVIAGIRAAFKNVIHRFDPDILEQQFDKHSKPGLIASVYKGKHWVQYRDHYKNLTDNIENTFQYLYGDDFVEAYEEQMRKLASAKKRSQ